MRKIKLSLGSGRDFMESTYLHDLPGGGVFIPTNEDFAPGEDVNVEFVFPEIPEGISISGTVAWRRSPAKWRSAMKPGVGVSFGDHERSRVEFLIDFCSGELAKLRKPGRRVPVDLRADILTEDQRFEGRLKDLSRGGVFVLTDLQLARFDNIELDLFLPGAAEPERFFGSVAWCRSGDEAGLGIKFEFRSPIRRKRIGSLVSAIEGRLAGRGGVSSLGTVRA